MEREQVDILFDKQSLKSVKAKSPLVKIDKK